MSDLISRQEAIDTFGFSEKTRKYGGNHSGYDTMMLYEIQDVLENLTSAEPKKGKWEEKEVITEKVIDEWQSARCSVCDKYHTTPYMYYFDNFNYCPNCGADMRGKE